MALDYGLELDTPHKLRSLNCTFQSPVKPDFFASSHIYLLNTSYEFKPRHRFLPIRSTFRLQLYRETTTSSTNVSATHVC